MCVSLLRLCRHMHACVRACVRACVCLCVCVRIVTRIYLGLWGGVRVDAHCMCVFLCRVCVVCTIFVHLIFSLFCFVLPATLHLVLRSCTLDVNGLCLRPCVCACLCV